MKDSIEIIKDTDEKYPIRLREVKGRPRKLYVKGDSSLLNNSSIAIVGSRDIDEYGYEQAKRFSSFLSQKGLTIISGLARGVDSVAHTYSKEKKGKTIAVLASGFNYIYPEENKRLYEEILEEGGCVITEWEEDTPVDMNRFPKRNRIISGLSVATLVIEAKYKSGSTITARYSMKQQKPVFCIPGNIDRVRSGGTNKLISEGAYLVVSPVEILEILEYEGYNLSKENKVKTEYIDVYKNIGTIPITANEISRLTNKKVNEVNEILFMLEIDKFIKSFGTGRYVINESED